MNTIFVPKAGAIAILAILSLLLVPLVAFAGPFVPVFNPTLEIKKLNSSIAIDGRLDDSGWKNAVKAENFVERYPGKNIQPMVATQVFVTYDNRNLYVAFNCLDDPAKLRASMTQRDMIGADDNVCLLIDTYGTAAWAYEFFVNPYGIQSDRLWSSILGEDSGFDMIWQSAAAITDSGYQVEIAIPFSSMRFPNRDIQTWKMDFWRNHPRENNRQYSWSAYNEDDQCWVCQWGTVGGIKGVYPGKGLEIMPTIVGTQYGYLTDTSDPNSRFQNDEGKAQLSLGGKYSISSDFTIEATYNPDFSQIEADAAQIDVNSTIALMYPERRPFFQEGSDIFQTPFNSFYSRTVNDPQFAAKLTGRMGRGSLGFVSALDENTPYVIPLEERSIIANTGRSMLNALRGAQSFGANNRLGFILTDRRFEGGGDGYGTVAGLDGQYRLTPKYSVVGQYIMSWTREPDAPALSQRFSNILFDDGRHTAAFDGESFSGDAVVVQLRRRAAEWNFTLNYDHTAPTYRTETGYDPWNDYRNFSVNSQYTLKPGGGPLLRVTPMVHFDTRYDFGGERKWINYHGGIDNQFRFSQAYLELNYNRGEQKWGGVNFEGLWTFDVHGGAQFGRLLGVGVGGHYGPSVARWLLQKGNETAVSVALNLKPLDRLGFEPTVNFYKMTDINTGDELIKQTIGRVRVRYQANRELSLRFVTQYNDLSENWDFDPLVTYRLSPFSLFYIGSTHDVTQLQYPDDGREVWQQTSRQFFAKLQYLFRV